MPWIGAALARRTELRGGSRKPECAIAEAEAAASAREELRRSATKPVCAAMIAEAVASGQAKLRAGAELPGVTTSRTSAVGPKHATPNTEDGLLAQAWLRRERGVPGRAKFGADAENPGCPMDRIEAVKPRCKESKASENGSNLVLLGTRTGLPGQATLWRGVGLPRLPQLKGETDEPERAGDRRKIEAPNPAPSEANTIGPKHTEERADKRGPRVDPSRARSSSPILITPPTKIADSAQASDRGDVERPIFAKFGAATRKPGWEELCTSTNKPRPAQSRRSKLLPSRPTPGADGSGPDVTRLLTSTEGLGFALVPVGKDESGHAGPLASSSRSTLTSFSAGGTKPSLALECSNTKSSVWT